MIGQTHCRGIYVLLSFKTRLPFDLLPEWHDVRALPDDEQMRALRDPAVREQLVNAAMEGDYARGAASGRMPRKPDFDGIRVYEHGLPPNPTVAEVAAQRGVSPVEAMIDLALETDFEQLFIQPSLYPQDPDVLLRGAAPPAHGDDVLRLGRAPEPDRRLVDPHAPARPLGARPPGVHPRGGGAHDHARAGAGVGVRRPRSGARGHGRRPQRVRSRPGRVRRCRRVVNDLPEGGKRLCSGRSASGRRSSNGEITIDDGEPTGALPGRLVRNRVGS